MPQGTGALACSPVVREEDFGLGINFVSYAFEIWGLYVLIPWARVGLGYPDKYWNVEKNCVCACVQLGVKREGRGKAEGELNFRNV